MQPKDRRSFLKQTGTALIGATALNSLVTAQEKHQSKGVKKEKEEEVTPVEDLGREHGLLNRILLIYDESGRRLHANADFDPKPLADAAGIIQKFIESYHEKLEEDYLFPRFEKAHKLTDLVAVLRQQHQAGRTVTGQILQLANASALKNSTDHNHLGDLLNGFVRMYRPHEAREDTILFPAIRSIVSEHEYDSLGEDFEKKEHELFGKEGFEGMLDKVEGIEKNLGIYDLSQFTPR
jgi:hemerythrin-like domain-containing protein